MCFAPYHWESSRDSISKLPRRGIHVTMFFNTAGKMLFSKYLNCFSQMLNVSNLQMFQMLFSKCFQVKSKIVYGQEFQEENLPLQFVASNSITITRATIGCCRSQPDTDIGVRVGRSNWLHPSHYREVLPERHLYSTNRCSFCRESNPQSFA